MTTYAAYYYITNESPNIHVFVDEEPGAEVPADAHLITKTTDKTTFLATVKPWFYFADGEGPDPREPQ